MSKKQICNYCKNQERHHGNDRTCILTGRDTREYEPGTDCVNWESKRGVRDE